MIILIAGLLFFTSNCSRGDNENWINGLHSGYRMSVRWVDVNRQKMGLLNIKLTQTVREIFTQELKNRRNLFDGKRKDCEFDLAVTAFEVIERNRNKENGNFEEGNDGSEIPEGEEEEKEENRDSEPVFRVVYDLRYRGPEGWPLSSEVSFVGETRSAIENISSIQKSIKRLVLSVGKQVDLLHRDLQDLRKVIQNNFNGDEEVLALAVRIIGENRDNLSVPQLCRLLERTPPSNPLREDIIGALEKIGDKRATPSLIKAFSDAEPWQEIQILRALSVTGGEEAKMFLEVVASGHEIEHTRKIAEESLKSLK